MSRHPRLSKEQFAARGEEIYERDVLPYLDSRYQGKFAAIDIDTGAYEIDSDELVASDRLRTRNPDAQIWVQRVGSRFARRFGANPRMRSQ